MISVIVPVYNLEGYIGNCLRSLAKQTVYDFEVIIVDDGSTDQSNTIIRQFCRQDTRFQLLTKANGGVSSARNIGLQYAKGEYIAFVDGDDYVAADYLEFLLANITEDTVLSMCKAVDPPLCTMNYGFECERKSAKRYRAEECAKWLLQGRFFPRVWGALFRRSCLQSLSFMNANNGEDKVFLYSYLLDNNKGYVAFSNATLYGYFNRPGSATKKVWNGSKDAVCVEDRMYTITKKMHSDWIEIAYANKIAARFSVMKQIILSGNHADTALSVYQEMINEIKEMNLPRTVSRRTKVEYIILKIGEPAYRMLVKAYYLLNTNQSRHRENERRKVHL